MSIIGWIRMGDKASCGGTVAEGDPTCISFGKPLAFEGAKMACRKNCIIAEGLPRSVLTNGRSQVVHGMATSNGCPLTSTLIGKHGTDNASGAPVTTAFFQPAQAADGVAPDEPSDEPWVPGEFDDRYVLVGLGDGKPLAEVNYAIEREDGSIEHGTTDAEGHTHLLKQTLEAEHVRIYLEDKA